ncbi:methyltransferase [Siminovitchia terrae]|uniref:Methyltransferase n=1 Tax=Siminovitchia terrae TaxID=1914933 RepID=A0ABQ4KUK6_SIMTE|nr:SAM-dependent methyltransferase [Siminovitchia terrae]GIN95691.1 methyltransferase [Siminovitchia terrae]
MIDYKQDKLLSIKTTDEQRIFPAEPHYNPYEPTPYEALDQLFSRYRLTADACLVDMGCGKGRVPFYVHYHFQASAVGIEMNPALYEDALKNKASYSRKAKRGRGSVEFQCILAQEYNIQPGDNVFFFFNPFSAQIFMTVVQHILESVEKYPRTIDLILYYPSNEYVYYLLNHTQFKLVEEVQLDCFYERNDHERILIYRMNKGGL